MRMLRHNTRAPSPRRLRDRLHARSTLAKVGFLSCLHAISLERSRFRKNAQLKSKISQPCTARLASRRTDSYIQTDKPSTVTLAAHARRGLIPMILHTSSHSLAIETGRFHKPRSLPVSDRLYMSCCRRRVPFFVPMFSHQTTNGIYSAKTFSSILLHACGAEVHTLTQPLSPCCQARH